MGKKFTKPQEQLFTQPSYQTQHCPLCLKKIEYSNYDELVLHIDECEIKLLSLDDKFQRSNTINIPEKLNKSNFIKYVPFESKGNYCYTGKKHINGNFGLNFDKKMEIFKKYLQSVKINWTEGCNYLQLTRDKFFEQSLSQFPNINIYKVLI